MATPLPKYLAHLKREISEKKWVDSPPLGWRLGRHREIQVAA
jgi:hypothetical protein